jgi:hypothetical protein
MIAGFQLDKRFTSPDLVSRKGEQALRGVRGEAVPARDTLDGSARDVVPPGL